MAIHEETVNDPFEHEIEYDRLCDSLTGKGADMLAVRLHASQEQLYDASKLSHLHAVAELAAKYADIFYAEDDFNAQRYRKTCCKLAGLLHEAMEWGGTFEQIVDVADETVARMISDLTPDRRHPRPKRRKMLFNQLGLSNAPTQIVKFSDLQHEAHHLLTVSPKTFKLPSVIAIREWLDDALEILPLLDKIRTNYPFTQQMVKLKMQLDELTDICLAAQAKFKLSRMA